MHDGEAHGPAIGCRTAGWRLHHPAHGWRNPMLIPPRMPNTAQSNALISRAIVSVHSHVSNEKWD